MDGMIRHDAKCIHHPHAHVTIQMIIRGEHSYIMLLQQLSTLEKRCTHVDAQSLRFIRTRDNTTVIVAEYHNGTAIQMRLEQAFAGTIEAVAVDDSEQS